MDRKRTNSFRIIRLSYFWTWKIRYKLLTQVERAFRSFKNIDLKVRPIRHRRENRVRAHIFLCMLSYYVLWHMMEAWGARQDCEMRIYHHATRR